MIKIDALPYLHSQRYPATLGFWGACQVDTDQFYGNFEDKWRFLPEDKRTRVDAPAITEKLTSTTNTLHNTGHPVSLAHSFLTSHTYYLGLVKTMGMSR